MHQLEKIIKSNLSCDLWHSLNGVEYTSKVIKEYFVKLVADFETWKYTNNWELHIFAHKPGFFWVKSDEEVFNPITIEKLFNLYLSSIN